LQTMAGLGQTNNAHEARRAIAYSGKPAEQKIVIRLVAGAWPSEAGGVNAWLAAESVEFEPRIVGKDKLGSEAGVVARLQSGIFRESQSRFFRRWNSSYLRKRFDAVPGPAEIACHKGELAQFTWILRAGEEE